MKRSITLISTILSLSITIASAAHAEDRDLAGLCQSRQINGTMVISSLDGSKTYIYNAARAHAPLLPASTFKIPNTLIALEENAVADATQIIKWDGKDRGVAAWNKDQCLETAFPSSCIWFYQELARRVGRDKYAGYLRQMHYGNARPGPELTTFWLQGDLRISAVEQIAFLKKIYRREFAFKPSAYALLRQLMLMEQTPAYALRAKTGWAQGVTPQIGWFVGYVESRGQVCFFATNLDIIKPADATLRQQLTLEALRLKGII